MASGGQGEGLGDVDIEARALAEEVAEADGGLLDDLSEVGAALAFRLGSVASVDDEGEAVDEVGDLGGAVGGGRRGGEWRSSSVDVNAGGEADEEE